MTKTIVLHIGLSKAGSSSIQAFCASNRSALATAGACYPEATIDHPLAPPVLARGVTNLPLLFPMLKDLPARYGHLEEAVDPALPDRIADAFFAAPGLQTMIVSTEIFSTTYHIINYEKLRSFLRDAQVKIVMYVRQMDTWIESLYATHMASEARVRGYADHPPLIDDSASLRNLQAQSFLLPIRRFRQELPDARLLIRSFEETQRHEGLLSDFLRHACPEAVEPLREKAIAFPRQNTALHPEQTLFLAQLGSVSVPVDAFLEVRRALNRSRRRADSVRIFKQRVRFLSAQQIERIRAFHCGEVEALNKEFETNLTVTEPEQAAPSACRKRLSRPEYEAIAAAIGPDVSPAAMSEVLRARPEPPPTKTTASPLT